MLAQIDGPLPRHTPYADAGVQLFDAHRHIPLSRHGSAADDLVGAAQQRTPLLDAHRCSGLRVDYGEGTPHINNGGNRRGFGVS